MWAPLRAAGLLLELKALEATASSAAANIWVSALGAAGALDLWVGFELWGNAAAMGYLRACNHRRNLGIVSTLRQCRHPLPAW